LIIGESSACAAGPVDGLGPVAGPVAVGPVLGFVGPVFGVVGAVAPAWLSVIRGGLSGVVALRGIMNPLIEPSVYWSRDAVIV